MIIAGIYLLAGHFRIQTDQLAIAGNGTLALAAASVLVPLAILWGWTWVSDRWSGRSGLSRLDYRWSVARRHLKDLYHARQSA